MWPSCIQCVNSFYILTVNTYFTRLQHFLLFKPVVNIEAIIAFYIEKHEVQILPLPEIHIDVVEEHKILGQIMRSDLKTIFNRENIYAAEWDTLSLRQR